LRAAVSTSIVVLAIVNASRSTSCERSTSLYLRVRPATQSCPNWCPRPQAQTYYSLSLVIIIPANDSISALADPISAHSAAVLSVLCVLRCWLLVKCRQPQNLKSRRSLRTPTEARGAGRTSEFGYGRQRTAGRGSPLIGRQRLFVNAVSTRHSG
jgi:hypothetical protein